MKARTKTPRRPSAGWPLDALIWGLRRARWGDLATRQWHGVRAVLLALSDVARQTRATRTGRIEATEWQLAGMTGYEIRWVRVCLQRLEYAGIVTWWRGGVVEGRPQPSIFLVSRRAVAALLAHARGAANTAELEHRAETMKRLQKIRSGFVRSKEPRFRRSEHAEVNADLPPSGEVSTGRTPHPRPISTPMTLAEAIAEAIPSKNEAPSAPSPDNKAPPGLVIDAATRRGADAVRIAAGLAPKGLPA